MKNLTLLVLFISFNVFSQSIDFNNLNKEGNFNEYISESGISFKVGDIIKIGLPSNGSIYTFITQAGAPCAAVISNTKNKIVKIKIIGSKKRGYKAYLLFGGYGINCYIDIENAILRQEVIID
jgi:hypothetical protein